MAKLKGDPIQKEDISEYVSQRDSFAFEMEVVNAVTSIGFECQHGGFYDDPASGTMRQFDIRASRNDPETVNDSRISRVFQMAIECKKIGGHWPLVVSRAPRVKGEAFAEIVEATGGAGGVKLTMIRKENPARYGIGGTVGKGTMQIARREHDGELIDDDGETSIKWTQAIASSRDMISEVGKYVVNHSVTSKARCFTMPILVVPDDRLWAVDYDKSGKLESGPKLIKSTSHFISKVCETEHDRRQKAPKVTLSHLEIFTLTGLKEFLSYACEEDAIWCALEKSEDSNPPLGHS